MKPGKKLVIFDIDGTLIRPNRLQDNLQRFPYSIKKVYGVDIGTITEDMWQKSNFNGKGDRYILWHYVEPFGISRDQFLDRIGEVGEAFVEYFESIRQGGASYVVIPSAKKLVDAVIAAPHLSEGVLTGNLGPSAVWKLRSAGLPEFAFGVYGHEADAREDLAKLLVEKAAHYYDAPVKPSDIVIVGDTVNDVLCAKAIGATSLIVTTGWRVSPDSVKEAGADIVVDSLTDPKVNDLLELTI
jgi:phosphoglycolate phosphatase